MRLRRGSKPRIRILFATDLHGSDVVFRKFLNAARIYEADIAILGGDLTGKMLVPIVESNGGWVASIAGEERRVNGVEDLAEVEAGIRNLGHYPVTIDRDEYKRLEENEDVLADVFERECEAQVEAWMKLAAERLEPHGIPLYVTGGNDDLMSVESIIERAPYVTGAEGRAILIAPEVEMISSGYSNPTPWNCPRDISEEELGAKLEAMAEQLEDVERAVFNLHVPPFESGLDQCARLDTSLSPPRPIIGEEISAGSTAVRDAIETHAPLLSLHGHIHECRGVQRIGRTTCVNPGSEYGEGVLRSAVVDLAPEPNDLNVQLLSA